MSEQQLLQAQPQPVADPLCCVFWPCFAAEFYANSSNTHRPEMLGLRSRGLKSKLIWIIIQQALLRTLLDQILLDPLSSYRKFEVCSFGWYVSKKLLTCPGQLPVRARDLINFAWPEALRNRNLQHFSLKWLRRVKFCHRNKNTTFPC